MRVILVVLFMGLSTAYLTAQNAEPEGAGASGDGPSIEGSRGGDARDETNSADYPPLRVRIIDTPDEAERAERREDDSDQRERDDLTAQQSMAESTERIVLVSWWQLGLATGGTILVFGSLFAAFQSNWIARSTGMAQVRAYLHIDDILLQWEEGQHEFGKTLRVRPVWKNLGQTPARNVRWSASYELGVVDDRFEFPTRGYDTTATVGSGASARDISVAIIDAENVLQRGDGPITVYGSIEYNDVFDRTPRRRTEFHIYVDAISFSETDPKCQIYSGERHNGADSDCLLPPMKEARDRTSIRFGALAT